MATNDDSRIALKRNFADFLDREWAMPDNPNWKYSEDGLQELYTLNGSDGKDSGLPTITSRRLMIHAHHLREFNSELLRSVLQRPAECLPAFEDALKDAVKASKDQTLSKLLTERDELHVGLKGDFGRHEVSPRELTSERINQLACVFGIVTKCSLVRPKVVKSVHYCEATKQYTTREYRDVTALTGLPTGAQYPTKDDNGNLLTTEYGLCVYRDSQVVTIQELPETAPPGQMPHSTEIILEDDLVDKVKPGDRVSILGIYKAMSGSKVARFHGGTFKATVVGVSVQKLTRENTVKLTHGEILQIRKLSERNDILDLLAHSLAPSIYGHEIIKRGLILQLFGGLEKNLENGTHLRGDINCLLVGDPGVAKSQMLRACMNVAPHAVSTTGRGCSGVGLTAAVTHDNETGEKRLEAGAMVLADRGVVCIDEFDKMSDQDRTAIHEVMEQQTVTIAKAGIHCSLNARCSVLAAANPIYGSYDKSASVTKNVNLPDSLLSRFDMLFVVLDQMNDEKDRQVALHVIKQHRYRPAGEDGRGASVIETIHDRALIDETRQGGDDEDIFIRKDARLTSGARAPQEALTSDFLRKFVIFARRRYAKKDARVEIEPSAAERIVEFYADLRSRSHQERALPVTARTLETVIRLATAACKIRLDSVIRPKDVLGAIGILEHCMKRDVGSNEDELEGPGADATMDEDENSEDDEDEDDEDYLDGGKKGKDGARRRRRAHKKKAAAATEVEKKRKARDGRRSGAPSPAPSPDDAEDEEMVDAEGEGQEGASPTKRQKRAVALLGLPAADAAGPSSRRAGYVADGVEMTEEQRKIVLGCISELLQEVAEDVPISELKIACMDKGLEVEAPVLLAELVRMQVEYSDGCGMPQIMVNDDDQSFFLVN